MWIEYMNCGRVKLTNNKPSDPHSEISARVYRLFDLTPEEIQLLQKKVEH